MHPFFTAWQAWRRSSPPFDAYRSGSRKAATYDAELQLDHVRGSVVTLIGARLSGRDFDFDTRIQDELANLQLLEYVLQQLGDSGVETGALQSWSAETRALLIRFREYIG